MIPIAPGFVYFFTGSGLVRWGARHICVPVSDRVTTRAGAALRSCQVDGIRWRDAHHGRATTKRMPKTGDGTLFERCSNVRILLIPLRS